MLSLFGQGQSVTSHVLLTQAAHLPRGHRSTGLLPTHKIEGLVRFIPLHPACARWGPSVETTEVPLHSVLIFFHHGTVVLTLAPLAEVERSHLLPRALGRHPMEAGHPLHRASLEHTAAATAAAAQGRRGCCRG